MGWTSTVWILWRSWILTSNLQMRTTCNAQRRFRVPFWCGGWLIIQSIENGAGRFSKPLRSTPMIDDEGYTSLDDGTKILPTCRDEMKSFWLVSGQVICIERVVCLTSFSRSRHWNISILYSPLEISFRLLEWFSTLKHMRCLSSTRRGSKRAGGVRNLYDAQYVLPQLQL